MATDKYALHTIDYSVQGWDAILTTDMEKLDDVIHSRIKITAGETIAQYDAVYLETDGKYDKALADGSQQPAMGLALESAVLNDEILIQRIGPITNAAWTWATVSAKIYLDASTPGTLTDVRPANAQMIGIVLSATSIFLWLDNMEGKAAGYLEGLVDAVLTDDHSWTGPTQSITVGETVAIFDTLYLKSDGKYWKTDADAKATAKGKLVMATAAITADASGIVLLGSALSFIRDDSTDKWTVVAAGDEMYLGLTPGLLVTDVTGYTTGDIKRVVGHMETAVILNFNPSQTYLEVT